MASTVTSTESWFSRIGSSVKGIFAGIVLFVAGFPVLFWNEGRAVDTAKAIDEGEGECISLESPAAIDPAMNGKLVHLTGKADTADILADGEFGVSVKAISLERKVEMFQWVEESSTSEKKNLGGSVTKTTTYSYKKDWCESAVDSGSFHESGHDNPPAMEFESSKTLASNVSFGAFRLGERDIARIGSGQTYVFPTNFVCKIDRAKIHGSMIYVPEAKTRSNPLNNRDVVTQPRVGDMRVSFRVVYPHEISIVAKQHGDTFVAYTAKNGKKLSYLADGVEDAASMFASARTGNKIATWFFRIIGFLMMNIGLGMVLKPLSVLADVLPILGDIVGIGTGLVSFVVSIACALATVAVAWLFYRPVLAIVLLAAAAGMFILIAKKRKPASA